jgi:hypothetical protein
MLQGQVTDSSAVRVEYQRTPDGSRGGAGPKCGDRWSHRWIPLPISGEDESTSHPESLAVS